MKKRSGNSVIEVMVVVTILTFGLVGAYGVLNSGQKLATSTENRIKGANIAREGIEIVQNIRDSNWIKFSTDYTHCWNVKDYDSNCIGKTAPEYSLSFQNNTSYIANLESGQWKLIPKTPANISVLDDANVRNIYPVYLDSEGLTTQSGTITALCNATKSTNCKTIFYREIHITYPFGPSFDASDKKMKVNSIVKWADSTKKGFYTINLETVLTNWKEDL